ncbi:MAG: hypothetical protein K2Y14_12960 [Burkholderiales bacterium]|nr:hypothetical protein [Burkholderiales bacterium]
MKKIYIKQKRDVEIKSILLDLPIRYEDEDIPFNFPRRVPDPGVDYDNYDRLKLLVDISTGEILAPKYPKDFKYFNSIKVCDEGIYILYDEQNKEVARHECYVPRCVPNYYGDYVNLDIEDGFIKNWGSPDNFVEFDE